MNLNNNSIKKNNSGIKKNNNKMKICGINMKRGLNGNQKYRK